MSGGTLEAVLAELADASPEQRTLVADVFVQAIGDGRVDSEGLAAALGAFVAGGDATRPGRAAAALHAAAASSPLHRAVVRCALVQRLPTWSGQRGRPLCDLLGLLDELCAASGAGVSDPGARAELEGLATGRSRSAGLARAVLSRSGGADWPAEAAALALAARAERAGRGGTPGYGKLSGVATSAPPSVGASQSE